MSDGLFERLLATFASTEFVTARRDGSLVEANAAFASHVGVAESDLRGRAVSDFLAAADAERLEGWLAKGPPEDPVRLNFVTSDGAPYTLRCLLESGDDGLRLVGEPESALDQSSADELLRLNNELAIMARERARRQRELERTRRELENTLGELETSYWHLRKIQEVLPLCMRCGKVKADEARWQTVVDYLSENKIFMSHGYCPSCAKVVLQDYGLEPGSET